MVTGDIKSKIDAIWNTMFAAGITNPISVMEQMTFLFFMKMLDDKQVEEEATAEMIGYTLKSPTFPEGLWHNPETDRDVLYNDMRWHVFKNTNADSMFNMVRFNVFAFIKNIGSGEASAYSKYMKNANFIIPTAAVLQAIVDGIDSLDMNDTDSMGDVYEYILGKMAASGQNGQFRTPRHIIWMMVEIAKPTLDDIICDPAMGSAGFDTVAAEYVKKHYQQQLEADEKKMEHFNKGMFYGYDSDQTMLRIGAMNMMLHGVEHPHIDYRDSLSDDNNDVEKYTLNLANPPFSGNVIKSTINQNLLAITNTTKTELLFLGVFIRDLKLGGRCVSIVPDGVLFGSSNAHLAIRKEIVDHQCLRGVISMPGGVFQPYSAVSTAILIFTKTNDGGTDKVWFYEMHADGYSLDARRSPVQENDIPDVIARWNNLEGEKKRKRTDQSFLVPVNEIRANDYDLTFNKYKEVIRKNVEYDKPGAILQRIISLEVEVQQGIDDFRKLLEN